MQLIITSRPIKNAFFILLGLSWLTFVSAGKAQYHCSVRLPGQYGTISNFFYAFATNGNYCTVAMMENADTGGFGNAITTIRLIFQHSTDGGHTWQRQDPGIKIANSDYYYITSIVQIDSMNEFAVGDSARVLRTTDGGQTWQRQNIPLYSHLHLVSFANPNEGMIIGANDSIVNYNIIYTTTDGGTNWVVAPMNKAVGSGRAYGNGKFRFFQNDYGTTYTTLDNFQTIDSTKPIFDSIETINGHDKLLVRCNFGSGDSIIAYGEDVIYDTITHVNYYGDGYPLIWRTTNAGLSWSEVFDMDSLLRDVNCMTDIDRDTVFAGVSSDIDNILISTDHGTSWKVDTLLIDTSMDVLGCFGIGLTPNGNLVGAFGPVAVSLIYGQLVSASVPIQEQSTSDVGVYPNPATNILNLVSPSGTISISDPLGREYPVFITPQPPPWKGGGVTIDISTLPPGVYFVSDGVSRAKFVKE